MKRLVILGAGTGGTIMANLLRKRLRWADWAITVIDRDNDHYYQPGFLFIPFGFYTKKDIVKSRSKFLPRGVKFIVAEVDTGSSPTRTKSSFRTGAAFPMTTSSSPPAPRSCPPKPPACSTAGVTRSSTSTRPTGPRPWPRSSRPLRVGRSSSMSTRRPSSAPSRPLEFAFFCDWCLVRHHRRDKIELVFVTPLPGAFTKPVASKALGSLLAEKRVRMVTDFNAERIDAAARKLVGYDGREVPYDLLVTIPTNMGSEMIERSGMGNEFHFLPTDPNTLQSKKYENIFAIGDATDLPSSKAGSVAHFQSEIPAENLVRAIEGKPLEPAYDGHSNCFIETGLGKAILIDFNYEVEPLPGRFPFPVLGPMPLLKPSRINHWGKLAFRWIYWHMLLRGRPIPFVPARMKMAGKKRPASADGAPGETK